MPEVARELNRARRQLYVFAVLGCLVIIGGQLMQVRATRALAAAVDSSRIEIHLSHAELENARADRQAAIGILNGVRADLDALMAAGRRRSISRDRELRALAQDLRARLSELDAVSDSMRVALPPPKRKR